MTTPTSRRGDDASGGRHLVRVRIYCHEADPAGHGTLPGAVVTLLWQEHASGVTVLTGSQGFGAERVVGRGVTRHPVVVEWLDTADAVDRIWTRLGPLVADTLVTRDVVAVLSMPHRLRPRLDPSRTVADVMRRDVVTVPPGRGVEALATLMYEHDLRFLPVVDAGRLAGVVTNGDLVRHGVTPLRLELHRALATPPQVAGGRVAADVMSRDVVTVTPATRLVEAARLMIDRGVKRLPVVENDVLVGVVSRFDVLRSVAIVDTTTPPHPLTGRERTAGEVARQDVPTVHPDASVSEVLDAVSSTRLNRAVVVDAERRVVGVISDTALLKRVEVASEGLLARLMRRVHTGHPEDPAMEARSAADLVASPVVTVARSTPLEEAIRVIVAEGRKILPVLDEDGRLYGVIDRSDALRALALHGAGDQG